MHPNPRAIQCVCLSETYGDIKLCGNRPVSPIYRDHIHLPLSGRACQTNYLCKIVRLHAAVFVFLFFIVKDNRLGPPKTSCYSRPPNPLALARVPPASSTCCKCQLWNHNGLSTLSIPRDHTPVWTTQAVQSAMQPAPVPTGFCPPHAAIWQYLGY